MNRSFIFTETPEKGSKKSWQLNYSKTFIKKGFALFITSSGCYDFARIFTQLQIILTNTPSMMLGEQHNSFFSTSLFIRLGIWDKWNNFLLLKKISLIWESITFFLRSISICSSTLRDFYWTAFKEPMVPGFILLTHSPLPLMATISSIHLIQLSKILCMNEPSLSISISKSFALHVSDFL